MPYAIEIQFDQQSESRIRELWQQAAFFYGSDYLIKNTVIPHIALLVGDSKLQTLFPKIEIPSGIIRLSGISFFGDGSISYLDVELSDDIINFHRSAYYAALALRASVDTNYSPDNWIPHCTIAQNCTRNRKQIMAEFTWDACIRSLILVHYPPTSLLGERITPQAEPQPNKAVEATG